MSEIFIIISTVLLTGSFFYLLERLMNRPKSTAGMAFSQLHVIKIGLDNKMRHGSCGGVIEITNNQGWSLFPGQWLKCKTCSQDDYKISLYAADAIVAKAHHLRRVDFIQEIEGIFWGEETKGLKFEFDK